MRCFVAIDLPPEVRDALGATAERLRAAAPQADVRWTAATAMHLTLAFLGEVAEERVTSIRDALAGVTSSTPPIALVCGTLGTFPGAARPRVVWAGIVDGLRELGLLASGVADALEPLGFAPERRPFRGHVTLGRVRSRRGFSPLARELDAAARVTFGRWTASHVVLYRSHLRRTGSVYEALAVLPLAGAVA
jgi:RNA 2',3'-cyclic 3'-phosphodiesterase